MKTKFALFACFLLISADVVAQIKITIGKKKRNISAPVVALTAAELARRAELAMKARDFISAHEDYRLAAEIAEKSKDRNASRYWFGAGLAVDLHAETLRGSSSREKYLRDGVVAYQRSLKLEPAAPWTENNLALIELDLGSVKEAASMLTALVERSGQQENYALFATNLGDFQARQERWSDALKSYRSAILTEPTLTRAVDAFVSVARSHDQPQVTSLLNELLKHNVTDVAARIASDALRDPALADLRPAIESSLIYAAAQYVRQTHPERAMELLPANEDGALLAAHELLRTKVPNESTPATPSLQSLAAALGDASASAEKSEEAERLYSYGDANARLVDLYLSQGNRAKLTALAKKFDDTRVRTASEAAAAYEFHRAAMAAYGVLGDDPAAPEGTASFHAQKAKTFGGVEKIDVRDIDIYEQQRKLPPRQDQPPFRSNAGGRDISYYTKPDPQRCVPFDGKVDLHKDELTGVVTLTVTPLKSSLAARWIRPKSDVMDEIAKRFAPPKVAPSEGASISDSVMEEAIARSAQRDQIESVPEIQLVEVERSAARCGNVILTARGPRNVQLYDIQPQTDVRNEIMTSMMSPTKIELNLVPHSGPVATSDGGIVFSDGESLHFAALDPKTGKVTAASREETGEEIRAISISKSAVRIGTSATRERFFDITKIAEPKEIETPQLLDAIHHE